MIEWSLDAVRAAGIEAIVVACPPGAERDDPELRSLREAGVELVDGGETRAASVANALARVETEVVAVHDAARPLLDADLLLSVLATLASDPEAAGAIAAIPVTDTIKRASALSRTPFTLYEGVNGVRRVVEGTVDRNELWAAQTPQVFRVAALRSALEAATELAGTDESVSVERAGGTVLIHPAVTENLKVTTPFDLRVAELILTGREPG
jgi:2-C-methyl-D-erythritol 4-phosphate cytidylyltransferase